VHSKVRRLERELETYRQDLERMRICASSSEKAAATANEDMEQLRESASTRERKLLRDVELSEATRKELEIQVTSLHEALSELKSERERHDELYRNQRQAMTAHDSTRSQLEQVTEEHDALSSRIAEINTKLSESNQKCALLAADKAFLQDAKTQLELETAALRSKKQDLETQVREWQEKYDTTYGQSLVLQSEARLQFEKKLDDEMRKFMDVSRQEIERIRGTAQVVYERENRLLKDARDSALEQVETLEARLQTVQGRLDEKVRCSNICYQACEYCY
jgi:progesterone-induced-blocking factor 1